MVSQATGGVYLAQSRALFPVFVPATANCVQLSVSNGSSDRVALPTMSPIVRIHSTGDCFLNFGDASVTAAATNMPHAAGSEYYGIPDGATYVAAYGDGEAGTLTITPMDD